MPTCNKIFSLSRIIGFSYSEAALLSLDKAFSYRFLTHQQAKHINFKEMTAIFQAIARWIKTFRGSYLHIFCNNFVVVYGVQKISIKRKAIQLLCKIAMLYAGHDIEMRTH